MLKIWDFKLKAVHPAFTCCSLRSMLIDHRGHLDTTGRAARLDHVIQAAITEAMCLNREGHLQRPPAGEENPPDVRNGITPHGYSAESRGIHTGFFQFRRQRSLSVLASADAFLS